MERERGIYVWQLQFGEKDGLNDAFHSLLEADDLEDCTVEPLSLSIRFTATAHRGQELVTAIYELGELRWCSRHALRPGPSVPEGARTVAR